MPPKKLKQKKEKGKKAVADDKDQPPKKSKQKKEKGKEAVADDKDQLRDQLMALREELEQTKKQKNCYRQERDNIMVYWENSKRLLEQHQAQYRERVRVKEEREKHLKDQIKQVHTQLAHVKLEHYNAISELKIQAAASRGRMMNEFTERELALYQKREALQAVLLEKKSNVDKCLKAMMLKQELAIMEVKYKYDHIHKEKQRFHLEKFQEIMSGHANLMDKEMSRVLEDIAAKCRLRSQDVQPPKKLKQKKEKGKKAVADDKDQPPKKSKQKKEKGKEAVADDKDQLRDQLMALREELEQTKKQKNCYRQERDNIMVYWENSKRLLEQHQAQYRERVRVKEEREKHLKDQIKQVHTQLAHVKLEHYNAISELKIQAAASRGRMMNEFTERELALYQKREALQAVLLEKKSNVDKCLKAMMLKQELAIMEVKYKYDHIHKEKQRFHLEKFQEIMSGHAKLMDKEMSRVLEDIAAKCRLRSQDVQRQWQCLSDKAVSQVKMKKDVQPNAVEELILSDTSDSSDEEETM